MQALVIGVLMVAAFFALSAAIIAAAPYIAVGIIVVVALGFLSKLGPRDPPDKR